MVGRSLQNYYTRDYDTLKEDRVVLEVENLTKKGVFDNISFKVREGEILGFAGLVGAGRSEIMTCVFGADRFDSGRILLEGKEIRFKNCLEAINSGIAMVTEDRKKTGLTLSLIHISSALGAAAAIKASGKTGIGVYSIDASPDGKAAILDGSFTAVAAQVPIGIAETAFEKAEELLAGGEIEKEILLPCLLYTSHPHLRVE